MGHAYGAVCFDRAIAGMAGIECPLPVAGGRLRIVSPAPPLCGAHRRGVSRRQRFSVDMLYRGEFWSTDSHVNPQTPRYELRTGELTDLFPGERLIIGAVVGSSLAQSVVPQVEAALPGLNLAGKPRLYLLGEDAVVSAEQANALVGSTKSILLDALRQTGATVIDLFSSPVRAVTLFLGHRLNASVEVQCYEHPSTIVYVPTCRLRA